MRSVEEISHILALVFRTSDRDLAGSPSTSSTWTSSFITLDRAYHHHASQRPVETIALMASGDQIHPVTNVTTKQPK
ncbi:hypothetical protein N7G274_003259 [Stereocaulon virgatum]|uniref:Uncharacterized protein n=1 Tax=Stereocaulon virgatum TaxID=373712 RepID=A0ABR4AF52_9LECA